MESKETVPPPPVAAGSLTGAKAKIATTSFDSCTHQALLALANQILTGLAGNAAFPSPHPALAVVTAARDRFEVKLDAAAGGGKLATQQCRDARAALVRLLRDLALNVQQTSGGDRALLLSTGFPLQRGAQPPSVLPAPARLRLLHTGASGQILVRCASMRKARAYQWRVATATAPTSFTTLEPTTAARVLLVNQVPGSQVIAQVRVLGALGWSDWCDAVSAIVL